MLICITISHHCPGKTVKSTEGNYDGLQSQEGEAKFSATTHPSGMQQPVIPLQVLCCLQGGLLPAGNKALHFLIMKGHLIAQIVLPDNPSFIYWALMELYSCLPLLDASCFLLCKWLIGTLRIVVQDVCTNKLRQFECKVCAGKSIPLSSPRALLLGPYACMVAFSSFATPHVPWGNLVCSPRVAPRAVRFTLLKDLIGFVQY